MKRLISIILLSFVMATFNSYAQNQERITLMRNYEDKGSPATPIKRAPRPYVYAYLEGNIISFNNISTYSILTIYDNSGVLTYSTVLTPNNTTYTLPTDLKGEYKIILNTGSIEYVGYMNVM